MNGFKYVEILRTDCSEGTVAMNTLEQRGLALYILVYYSPL